MKSLTTKILAGILILLLFTTIGSQIYYIITDKHDTEEAVLCSINEDISFKGVIIRDEKVIEYDGNGILDYLYDDGNKVSVGSTIANIYTSEEDVIAQKKIEKINQSISLLKRAQNPGTINYVQPDTLKTKIDNEYKQILSYSLNNDFSSLSNSKNDLSIVINIYDVITGNTKSFNDQIESLTSQVDKLTKSSEAIGKITSEETGYFVSYADGYEDELNTENASELTEEEINNIINSKSTSQKNVVGKMFSDYSCKIVGIVDEDKRIVEGASLDMMISSSKQVYNIDVESVKPAKEEGKLMVVFSCDRLDKALVSSRVQSVKIIFDEYQGIKVPRKAIRFQDGQKGVYVLLGQEVKFKKIEVIYESEDDDFVISENTSDEDYLLLYDQILLEVISDKDVSDSSKSS